MAYEEIDKLEIPITKLRWSLRGTQIFFTLLAFQQLLDGIINFSQMVYFQYFSFLPYFYQASLLLQLLVFLTIYIYYKENILM
jgi:hypothetical protein